MRNPDLRDVLERVPELLFQLSHEYETSINEKVVRGKVKVLTHEVAEKLSNVLDMAFWCAWTAVVTPLLDAKGRAKAEKRVVFPVSRTAADLNATLGMFAMLDVESQAINSLKSYIESVQPYTTGEQWLSNIKEIARSKHTKLVPQFIREPYLEMAHDRFIGTSIVRRLQISSRETPEGDEYRFSIEGCLRTPDSEEDLPLDPRMLRVVSTSSLRLESPPVDPLEFLPHALDRVVEVVERLEALTPA